MLLPMTIKDIARLAGVSASTVSKVINGKDEHINPLTRSRVLEIVKEYNFTPYSTVKNISSTKKFLLGVLLHSVDQSDPILNGILRTAQSRGYGLLLLESENSPALEKKHITKLCQNNVDGVIWEPVSMDHLSDSSILERHKIPFCLLGSSEMFPAYCMDFDSAGLQLTRKLTDRGHTRIACMLNPAYPGQDKFLHGFQKCLYENQISFSDQMVFSGFDKDTISHLMQLGFTAAVSNDFHLAQNLYTALTKQHYTVPGDFSVVSLTRGHSGAESSPISSMPVPCEEFGGYVCSALIDICEKKTEEYADSIFPFALPLNHEKSICMPASPQKAFVSVGAIHKDTTFYVNTLPQSGSTVKILNSVSSLGGKGANQAAGITRLGYTANLIAAIGNDYDSSLIFNMLEEENISLQGICRKKKCKTGKAYIYLENDGESAITISPGANDMLMPHDIQKHKALFKNACFCLLSNEIPTETAIAAAGIARSNHVKTIFKPSVMKTLPRQLYNTTDILVPNRREAAALCPQYVCVEQQAEYFYSQGIPTVIITLGREGCYLKDNSHAQYFPAVNLHTVDTTGGADAFITALACYLYEGYQIERAIQIAMIAAAFCISKQGVLTALTDKDTLELYIAKTRPDLLRADSDVSAEML